MLAPIRLSDSKMNGLCGLLQRSYAEHARFRFPLAPFDLPAEVLAAFDDAFEFVRIHRGALTKAQFVQSRRRCGSALDAVFATLTAQAADPHERRFLSELRAECARLSDEELAHHARRPSGHGISMGNSRTQADANRLDRDGHFFGTLPASAVSEILRIGTSDIAEFRARALQGRCTRDDLSVNAGPHVKEVARLLNREYRTLGVLDAVSAYMGRRMVVRGLALELSVPQAQWWANSFRDLARAPHTLYAHLDESILFPKSIVYLSDVEPNNGPTSCYRHAYQSLRLAPLQEIVGRVIGNVGNAADSPLKEYYAKKYHQSMSSDRFRQHFMRLPPSLRFNSHFGWDVLPDSGAERELMAREKVMLGAAGTFIIFDGAKLLHRGGMVIKGDRIALQVVFAPSTLKSRFVARLRRVIA